MEQNEFFFEQIIFGFQIILRASGITEAGKKSFLSEGKQ